MAEAVGVAGTVVGIVSLGIELAQGLLKYYGSWKDQDRHISNLCASLDNLLGIFEILLQAIKDPARFNKSITDSIEKNIKDVEGLVELLRDELKKVQNTELPKPEERSIMRRHIRRALYPFKEDTLRKMHQRITDASKNLGLVLQALQIDTGSKIHHEVGSLVRWKEDLQTRSILSWLSQKNFWLQQADLSNRRQPGTGQWLLQHPVFLEWVEGNKETIWCRVALVLVKQYLPSATVVEFLESDLPVHGIALAFIYCDHKSKLSQTTEYFIGAVVRQIVERRRAIPENVRALYEKHRGKGASPTYTEYLDLLHSLAKECSEVYIVIDALDECLDKNGQPIWSNVLTKLKDSVPNLRLLYTSRNIDDTVGLLTKSSLIDVRASDADIRNYILGQLQSKDTLLQFCQQDCTLKDKILENVVSKAEGMFLAARLYIESLASKTNLRAVKKALDKLPMTLDGNYDEAMERIRQQPTHLLAMRVLLWIVYAVRPLQLEELQHAIAVDELEPDDQSVSEECLTPQTIVVNACAGMVKVDQESNLVRLVHTTAQEYFDRSGTKHFPRAHMGIGVACLKYLMLEVFSEGYCATDEQYEHRLMENALLKYAAQNWGIHVNKATEKSLYSLALTFLLDKGKLSSATQALFVVARGFNYSQKFPRDFDGMHYAACFGLKDIVHLLAVDCKVQADIKDSDGCTPLSYAALSGHEAVVKLLLDSGKVDVNSKGFYSLTPLSLAATHGHEAVVKLLLDSGKVDVDSKDSYSLTSLSLAALRGHEAVVKLLLDTGKVDVDSKGYNGETPLLLAVQMGHEAVVKLLLDTGKADVNSKNKFGETALSWLKREGHETVINLLLRQ